MINRALMQRQLRNRGGVMTVKTIRKKYGLGSDFQDFKDKALGKVRDIIPNELADVAVKAAPFVAPFNPLAAAAMRGIGRFDQRGSISDALKQGAGTFAFGYGARKLGGADGIGGFSMDSFSSPLSAERTEAIGNLFKSDPTKAVNKVDEGAITAGVKGEESLGLTGLIKKGIKALPKGVAAQLAAGTITAGASLLASYFQGDFREQEEGETMEDYLAARKEAVGGQMRTYMDNYFKFDSEYSTMTDAQKDAFVARYNVRDGGRIGFANGGDIERFKKALYAANQVDEATGDRLYGNQINSLYAQYQNNPSGFFSEPEMYTRFNASFNAPATREEDEDLLSLTGDGLLNQAAIGRSQQAARNEAALDMLNQSMAPTTQTPTTSTPSVVDISSAAATRPEDVDTTTLEEIMSEPLDAVPTNNPFQDTLGAPISEQRTSGINMSNTLRQNLLNNMEQRAANQRVLQAARAKLPGAGIMNAPSISNDSLRAPSDRIEEIRAQQLAAGVPPEGLINITTGLPPQMNKGGRVGFANGTENSDDSDNMFFKLVNKISPLFVDEDGDYRLGLQKAKFALSDFIAGKGTDLRTGAEWYNKLDADTQKEIIEEKIKYRETGKLGGVPLYDEEFAGKFGIGGNYANGGRIGFFNGTEKPRAYEALMDKEGLDREAEERVKKINELAERISKEKGISFSDALEQAISIITPNTFSNDGKTNMDGSPKINKAKGGLMSIPVRKNSEGTTELDYRKSGGFVPIGVKEKADDVPAMLSKNEFVMTADAVRAAGGGSIEKGAQRMYDTMKKLESRIA